MSQKQTIGCYESALEQLGKDYEDVDLIGRGSVGVVVSAIEVQTKERIAIKIIEIKGMSGEQRDYLEKELGKLRDLKHKYILPILKVIIIEKYLYLFMPYYEKTLNTILEEGETEIGNIHHILTMVADGLGYLHASGFIHRNLTPQKVFINRNGEAKISGYELPIFFEPLPSSASHKFNIYGNLEYMAPEWIKPTIPSDRDSNTGDIWSLAVILYYSIERCLPFDFDITDRILEFRYRPLSQSNKEVWDEVFKKLLCKMDDRLTASALCLLLEEKTGLKLKTDPNDLTLEDSPQPKRVQINSEIFPPEYLLLGGLSCDAFLRSFETGKEISRTKLEGNVYKMEVLSNSLVAIGTKTGQLYIWDTESQKVRKKTQTYGGKIFDIVEVGSGLLAVATGESERIEIFNISKLQRIGQLVHGSATLCMCLLRDGRLVCGTADKQLKIWNMNSWKLSEEHTLEGSVSQIIQLYDGRLAISTRDKNIVLFSLNGGNIQLIPDANIDSEIGIDSNNKANNMCELSPGILAWATKDYGTVKIWDIKEEKLIHSFQKENWRITKIKKYGEDKFLTASYRNIRVFELSDYTEERVFKCPAQAWDFCLYGGQGWKPPVFEEDFKFGVIKPNEPIEEPKNLKDEDFARPIGCFPPEYIMVGSSNNNIYLHKYSSPSSSEKHIELPGNPFKCVQLTSKQIAISEQKGTINFYDPKTKTIDKIFTTQGGIVFDMTELPGNILAVASGSSKKIELVNMKTQKLKGEVVHMHPTTSVDLVQKGKYVVGGDEGGYVILWDANTYQKEKELKVENDQNGIAQVIELTDGRIAISSDNYSKITLWNYRSDQIDEIDADIDANIKTINSDKINSMCEILPYHLIWGTNSHGTLRIYDYKTNSDVRKIQAPQDSRVGSIKLCGSSHFIVGSYWGVYIYDLNDWSEVLNFKCDNRAWECITYGNNTLDYQWPKALHGPKLPDEEEPEEIIKEYPPKKIIYGGFSSKLYVREFDSGRIEKSLETEGNIYKILSMGKKAWIGLSSGKIKIYDKESEEFTKTISTYGADNEGRCFAIEKISESQVAVGSGTSNKVEIWDKEGNSREKELLHDGGVTCLCVGKDGSLVTGDETGKVSIFNTHTWEVIKSKSFGTPIVQVLCLTDGRFAVSIYQKSLYIWDSQLDLSNEIPNSMIDAQMGSRTLNKVNSLCELSPGVLAWSLRSKYGTIYIWDLSANSLITSFRSELRRITVIKKIGKNNFICGSYGNINVYDLSNFHLIKSFSCSEQAWDFLCF